MDTYRNGITPKGRFIYGIHKPSYSAANLRRKKNIEALGKFSDGSVYINDRNFPDGDIVVAGANWIFEIANPLPFRGTTFIDKNWADASAVDHKRMLLPRRQPLSFNDFLKNHALPNTLIDDLPRPMLLTLATCSTDSRDLQELARLSCEFIQDDSGQVAGLRYKKQHDGRITASIFDHDLFEAVANNPALPDRFKQAMVLRPGAQGDSEIIGEWQSDGGSHVFEYLRRNSYISGGHFAANMADDAVRYSISSLSKEDMRGLRHLYYQRIYQRLGELLGIEDLKGNHYSEEELEDLRLRILGQIDLGNCKNIATLWGWNFGFDYSATDYRLHASHQQIHQQYATIAETLHTYDTDPHKATGTMIPFSSGDMVTSAIDDYSRNTGSSLFHDYHRAIANNSRMDGRKHLPCSLAVWQDDNVTVFVPKAQTSQWELQIMTRPGKDGRFCGNIVEADSSCRQSIDCAILKTQQIFAKLGAEMVTSIEYSKRICQRQNNTQPLFYSLMPKLPFSPGAFSEAQLRFINGHYPEDFATVCRNQL